MERQDAPAKARQSAGMAHKPAIPPTIINALQTITIAYHLINREFTIHIRRHDSNSVVIRIKVR